MFWAAAAALDGLHAGPQHPFNVSDATPTGGQASKWNQLMLSAADDPLTDDRAKYGCNGYVDNNLTTLI